MCGGWLSDYQSCSSAMRFALWDTCDDDSGIESPRRITCLLVGCTAECRDVYSGGWRRNRSSSSTRSFKIGPNRITRCSMRGRRRYSKIFGGLGVTVMARISMSQQQACEDVTQDKELMKSWHRLPLANHTFGFLPQLKKSPHYCQYRTHTWIIYGFNCA